MTPNPSLQRTQYGAPHNTALKLSVQPVPPHPTPPRPAGEGRMLEAAPARPGAENNVRQPYADTNHNRRHE